MELTSLPSHSLTQIIFLKKEKEKKNPKKMAVKSQKERKKKKSNQKRGRKPIQKKTDKAVFLTVFPFLENYKIQKGSGHEERKKERKAVVNRVRRKFPLGGRRERGLPG
jgi:hypothetical protein